MQKSEIIQIIKEELKLLERELTDKELKRRDKIADELPDAEFKKRYGKDYKSVKYATATKMAKREENDPEDGKAAPHGSGYNVVKEYNIQALRSLRKVVTEGKLNEAKFYATYNKGRGQGKAVVTSKESDFTKPRVFKNYNDAMKYVKFANRSPGMTSYWVSDINMNRIDKRGKVEESDFQLDQAFLDAKPVEERLKKGETGCCHHCGHSHRKGSAHVTPYRTGKNSCANRKSESSMNSNVIIYEEHPHDLPPDDKAIEEYDVVNEQDLREFLTYWKENYLCESCGYTETLEEAEYQGRKVKLGKPMQGDVKKFKVYVKNPKGNVVKVNFGQKGMEIKKDNPERRKSFRARHNCDSPGPRHKARYWSCRKW